MVTLEQFVYFIGGTEDDETDTRLLICLDVATAKVLDYIKGTCVDPTDVTTSSIPTSIVDLSIMKVGDELWNQRNMHPTVREQFDFGSGVASNTSRDPMLAAYPLLKGFVLPW